MTFFLDKQTSASDVFSSCPFLLRTNLELSLVMINNMVTRYDVIVGGWFFFKWKCMFFNMFQLENQTTPVGKMTQSTYLCVILHVKHKKLPILSVFTRFLFLGKTPRWRPFLGTSQASSSATTHKIWLILLRRWNAFQWRQNLFEIQQHIKTSRERFHQRQPPLYNGEGMTLCAHVLPRVN